MKYKPRVALLLILYADPIPDGEGRGHFHRNYICHHFSADLWKGVSLVPQQLSVMKSHDRPVKGALRVIS